MVNIFRYYTAPKSHMASARQVVVSLMKGNIEEGFIAQPNFIIEDSDYNIDNVTNSNILKEVNKNGRLPEKQMDEDIEILKRDMLARVEDDRIDKPNEGSDRAIEDLRRGLEMIQAQFEIEVLAREEKENRFDKLNSKIDKVIQFFKRETGEIHARFALEELGRRENRDEITSLKETVENIYQRLKQIQAHIMDVEMELTEKIESLEKDFKIGKEQIMLYVEEQKEEDLIDIFKSHLWKRITVCANGFELEGVLIQASLDHLVLISSSDIVFVPVGRIDFVSWHA